MLGEFLLGCFQLPGTRSDVRSAARRPSTHQLEIPVGDQPFQVQLPLPVPATSSSFLTVEADRAHVVTLRLATNSRPRLLCTVMQTHEMGRKAERALAVSERCETSVFLYRYAQTRTLR
jgi:hypothetical protein